MGFVYYFSKKAYSTLEFFSRVFLESHVARRNEKEEEKLSLRFIETKFYPPCIYKGHGGVGYPLETYAGVAVAG